MSAVEPGCENAGVTESTTTASGATVPSPVRPAVVSVIVLLVVLVVAVLVARAFPAIVDDWSGATDGQNGPVPVSLAFRDDGTLGGNDGCNTLFGEWSPTRDGAVVEQLASTLIFCMGVDTWLSGADRFVVDGDRLHVFDDQGTELGTLHRGVS